MRKSTVFATIMAAAAVVHARPAEASYAQAGYITTYGVEQGRVFFFVTGSRSATPACHTMGARWVFDGRTTQGQAMMSALLTYIAMGKQVVVQPQPH